MASKMSPGVKLILDFIVERYGDIEFSAEDAAQIWGGTEARKVSALTQTQLLQFALVEIYRQRDELQHIITTIQNMPLSREIRVHNAILVGFTNVELECLRIR